MMKYDIEKFVNGGYHGEVYREGLHVVFDTETEIFDFIEDVREFDPKIKLGALNPARYTFNLKVDNYGYVYSKDNNRILRTDFHYFDMSRCEAIHASNLIITKFDFDEIIKFTMED